MKKYKEIIKDISGNFIKEYRQEISEEFHTSFDLIFSELEIEAHEKNNSIATIEEISFSDLNVVDLSLIGIIYHVYVFIKKAPIGRMIKDLGTNFEEHIANLGKKFLENGYNKHLIEYIQKYLLYLKSST